MDGVQPGCPSMDPYDLAAIMNVLLDGKEDMNSALASNWDGIKIGFLYPADWDISPAVCIQDENSDRQKVIFLSQKGVTALTEDSVLGLRMRCRRLWQPKAKICIMYRSQP